MVKRWAEDFAESLEVESIASGPLDGDLIDEAIDLVGELIDRFYQTNSALPILS